MPIQKLFLLVIPAVVRAFTFFVDSLWGNVIKTGMSSIISSNSSLLKSFLIVLIITILFATFEKYLNGDLEFFEFRRSSIKNTNIGDPDTGVI
jgi:hypothetical protein